MVSDRTLAKALLLALSLCVSLVARAADSEEPMKSDVFILTPRIWFGTFVTPKEPDSDQVQDAIEVPMAGATFTYAPKALPNMSFLATYLEGSGQGTLIDYGFGLTGTTRVRRTDKEFLVRYNLLGPKLYLLGGWRVAEFAADESVGPFRATTDVTVAGPELGVGSIVELSRDGRHQFFSNLLVLFGRYKHDYRDNAGFTEHRQFNARGMDLNIGYQYWLTPAINFSARYRTFTLYYEGTIDNPGATKYKDLATFYGPEIGVSFAF